MRTLLLLAVLATFAAITSTAEAQWMRARRSSECANGQCGTSAVRQVASREPVAAEAVDLPQAQEVEQTAATQPVPAPSDPAPTAAPDAAPSTPAAVPATSTGRSNGVGSARSSTANDVRNGRSWRRIRSRT